MAYAIEQDNYRSKRSYVSTGAFNNSIYSYVTALNPTTFRQEGRLALVTASPTGVALTATNCPGGRVLRENGRKLYPGVNVGLAVGDTYQGATVGTTTTNHFWVGVFDAVTGVKGFINPNTPKFVVYNSDKSLEVVDQDETNGTGVSDDLATNGLLVLTNTVSGTSNPLAAGSAVVGTFTLAGATPVVVNTTAVATTSKIFLSRNTLGGTMGNFSITAQTAGTFSVTGTALDTSTVNWLVINTA